MRGVIRGDKYFIDGKEVSKRDFYLAFPPREIGTGAGLIGWKPIKSDAMAVHPKQRDEAIADAKAKGVPTEFLPDGRPIFSSRTHRRAYLRAYRVHDNDGGYGDG